MAGTIKHAPLESRTRRAKLKRGRQAHYQAIIPRRLHLGYQRWPDGTEGRWLARRNLGGEKYRVTPLGRADDSAHADGERVLSYEQALAAVRAAVDVPASRVHRLTVRQAMERYVEFKRLAGQPVSDLLSRTRAHILPVLGSLVVEELTAEQLRRWLANMAAMP